MKTYTLMKETEREYICINNKTAIMEHIPKSAFVVRYKSNDNN